MHVVIIGKGKGWTNAPYRADNIWAINDACLWRDGIDLVFEMHLPKDQYVLPGEMEETIRDCSHIFEQCRQKNLKIVTVEPIEGLDCIVYPLEAIKYAFGSDYFTDGISYMIAYAIYQGATSLDIYGVHMADRWEESAQRGCVEFWLGVALGRGIRIKINGLDSKLLTTNNRQLYVYNTPQEWINERVLRVKSECIDHNIEVNRLWKERGGVERDVTSDRELPQCTPLHSEPSKPIWEKGNVV
jgi:hypothetical protein